MYNISNSQTQSVYKDGFGSFRTLQPKYVPNRYIANRTLYHSVKSENLSDNASLNLIRSNDVCDVVFSVGTIVYCMLKISLQNNWNFELNVAGATQKIAKLHSTWSATHAPAYCTYLFN